MKVVIHFLFREGAGDSSNRFSLARNRPTGAPSSARWSNVSTMVAMSRI